jgi:hypothetical protein
MHSIQVDTKFTAGDRGTAEPSVFNGNPMPAFLYSGAGAWRFAWTVKGRGAYDVLLNAQTDAGGNSEDEL